MLIVGQKKILEYLKARSKHEDSKLLGALRAAIRLTHAENDSEQQVAVPFRLDVPIDRLLVGFAPAYFRS